MTLKTLAFIFLVSLAGSLTALTFRIVKHIRAVLQQRRNRQLQWYKSKAHREHCIRVMERRVFQMMENDFRVKPKLGSISVLAALLVTFMLAMCAFAIDYAYMGLIKAEAQRCADAGALAGAGAAYLPHNNATTLYEISHVFTGESHDAARLFVDANDVNSRANGYTTVPNLLNFPEGDVVVGRMLHGQIVPNTEQPNAVQVRIHMNDGHVNGSTSLFFPKLHAAFVTTQEAIAQIDYPTLLPFAVYDIKWDEGGTTDYNENGIKEVVVFPGKWNGDDLPPGNFGAIQIGPNGSADVLQRQIDIGPTDDDMAWHGNTLKAGDTVTGKTGVNSVLEESIVGTEEWEGILGKPRYIALYNHAGGTGTSAQFTLSRFVACRIIKAELQAGTKFVAVEPIDDGTKINNLRLVK